MTFPPKRSERRWWLTWSTRRSLAWSAAALLSSSGCGNDAADSADLRVVGEDPTDVPIRGLSREENDRFVEGDAHFENVFGSAEGLGPLYIRPSCGSCHQKDARGPGFVMKMALVESDGFTPSRDSLPWGSTLRPQVTGGAKVGIVPPEGLTNLKVSQRIGPAVFGRGYMEAVLDSEIQRVSDEQAGRADGIAGKIPWVFYRSETNPDERVHRHRKGDGPLIGRFGVKARIATIDDFTADAYQGDMGITSPLRPLELPNPEGLTDDKKVGVDLDIGVINAVADYVRMLAIPKRQSDERGAQLFASIKCSVCHVPALRTRANYPISVLADIDAPVYTDFLLHDMGDELSDGIVEYEASGRHWRTAPLIGLRHFQNFMHDGRAKTVEEAIAAHRGRGSEASTSVDAFDALQEGERKRLIDFVSGL